MGDPACHHATQPTGAPLPRCNSLGRACCCSTHATTESRECKGTRYLLPSQLHWRGYHTAATEEYSPCPGTSTFGAVQHLLEQIRYPSFLIAPQPSLTQSVLPQTCIPFSSQSQHQTLALRSVLSLLYFLISSSCPRPAVNCFPRVVLSLIL
jgi:hypothetical protein